MAELKPYPEYKDSGVEWIGEIPEDWEVKPLFTVLYEVKNKNSELKVTNVLSLSYGNIVKRDVETNHGLLPANFKNYNIVNNGNIVMRLTDLQNDKKSFRVGYVFEEGIITSAYITLSLKDFQYYYSKYLYYLLHAYDLQKIYYGLGDGVRQTMNFSDLKWLPILSYRNQTTKIITKFLDVKVDQINSLISDKKRLIELLEEKRQAIITETVTKGLDPNVKMKDSGIEWIGEIPEHWGLIKLKYVTELITKKSDKKLSYLGLEHVESGTGRIKEFKVQENITGESLEFQKFDVLFGKLRPYLKKCIVALEPGQCTSEFFVIRTYKESIIPFYLKNIMLSNQFIEFINSTTYGAKMPRANWDTVGNIKIPIPSLKEQKNIMNQIIEIDSLYKDLINKQKITMKKLKEYRESLIYEAVTGKIDLRNF